MIRLRTVGGVALTPRVLKELRSPAQCWELKRAAPGDERDWFASFRAVVEEMKEAGKRR